MRRATDIATGAEGKRTSVALITGVLLGWLCGSVEAIYAIVSRNMMASPAEARVLLLWGLVVYPVVVGAATLLVGLFFRWRTALSVAACGDHFGSNGTNCRVHDGRQKLDHNI